MKLNQRALDNFLSYLLTGSIFAIAGGAFMFTNPNPIIETMGMVCIAAGVCGVVSLLGTVAILILAHSLGEARRSNEAARKLYDRKGME